MSTKNVVLRDDLSTASSIHPLFHTGDMVATVLGSLPSGWLWCDGTSYSTSAYPVLYGVIGTTYNLVGDSAGTFRVPNTVGALVAGVTSTSGASGSGTHTHTFTANSLTSSQYSTTHTHTQNYSIGGSGAYHYHNQGSVAANGNTTNNPTNANKTGTGGTAGMSGGAHNHNIEARSNWGLVNSDNVYHGHNQTHSHGSSDITHAHSASSITGTTSSAAHYPASIQVTYMIKY